MKSLKTALLVALGITVYVQVSFAEVLDYDGPVYYSAGIISILPDTPWIPEAIANNGSDELRAIGFWIDGYGGEPPATGPLGRVIVLDSSRIYLTAESDCSVAVYRCLRREMNLATDPPTWNDYVPSDGKAWSSPGGLGSGDAESIGSISLTAYEEGYITGSAVANALQAQIDANNFPYQGILGLFTLTRIDTSPYNIGITGRLLIRFNLDLDLDMEGLAEDNEEDPGKYLRLNEVSTLAARVDPAESNVPVKLSGSLPGGYKLTLDGNEISLPYSWSLGGSKGKIFGIQVSDPCAPSTVLTLQYPDINPYIKQERMLKVRPIDMNLFFKDVKGKEIGEEEEDDEPRVLFVGDGAVELKARFFLNGADGNAVLSGKLPEGIRVFTDAACTQEILRPDEHFVPETSDANFYVLATQPTEIGTITLEYRTNQGDFRDTVKVKGECTPCLSGDCAPGTVSVRNGGVSVRIALGGIDYGRSSAGYLSIWANRPADEPHKPSSLAAFAHSDVNVITDSNNVIDYVETPQCTVDVDPNAPGTDGYYIYVEDVDGNIMKTILVEKIASGPDLAISEVEGGRSWYYEWSDANQTWAMSEGNDWQSPYRKTSRTEQWDGNSNILARKETIAVRDGDGNVVSEVQETYITYPWGDELIKRIVDLNGSALTEQWTFYDDINDANNYGHMKALFSDTGYWEHYQYGPNRKMAKKITQYGNNAYDGNDVASLEANNIVATYQISLEDLGTDGANEIIWYVTETPPGGSARKTATIEWSNTEVIAGETCDRTYDIVYADSNNSWDDTDNTITKRYTYASDPYKYQLRAVTNPDGTMTLYDYSDESAADYGVVRKTTVTAGLANADGNDIGTYWTKQKSWANEAGSTVWTKNFVREGANWITQSLVQADATEIDSLGRPKKMEHYFSLAADDPNNNDPAYTTATNYGCCGAESTTDRHGLTTEYTHDNLERLYSTITAKDTSAQVTTTYTYDAMDRALATVRSGDFDGDGGTSTVSYWSDGRVKTEADALDNKTFYTYRKVGASGNPYDSANDPYFYNETRTYPHSRSAGVIQVEWTDSHGRTFRSFTATVAADWDGNMPTGSEALIELSRTTNHYDWRGRLDKVWVYHNVDGLSGFDDDGNEGVDYYETEYLEYNQLDRLCVVEDPIGNVRKTVYDSGGRVLEEWFGDRDPGSGHYRLDMMTKTFYDSNQDGSGELQPYVTRRYSLKAIDSLPDEGDLANDYVYTSFEESYDANGARYVWSKPQNSMSSSPWTKQVYDAEGKLTEAIKYQNGSTTYVLTKTANLYDSSGRLAASRVHEVSSGSPTTNYLETTYAYDDASRQCKVTRPSGAFTKTKLDALGRVARSYLCTDEGTTTDPNNVIDDTIIKETQTLFDIAGRVQKRISYERNHDANFTDALSDDPNGAWHNYVYSWYDEGGRMTHEVNYGTNDGTPPDYPADPPEPNEYDDKIVTKYEHDDANQWTQVTNNSGLKTRTCYDAMGRTIRAIEAVDANEERWTLYEYDSVSHITRQAADMDTDGVFDPNNSDQVTTYVYGMDDNPLRVHKRDFLVDIIYPDGSLYWDCIHFEYYANGALRSREDQRGVVNTYVYYDDGALKADKDSNLPGDVDDTIRSITKTYDDLGRLVTITSHGNYTEDPNDTTNVVNQVKKVYDSFGNLTKEYQAHGQAVDGNSLYVEYAYDDTLDGNAYAKGMRRKFTRYPNGRAIHYTYGNANGISDRLSRVETIAEALSSDSNQPDANNPIATYNFIGAGRLVIEDYPIPDVKLEYFEGTSGTYPGLDRFGRVVKRRWYDYDANVPTFEVHYAYDQVSNRTYAKRQVYKSHSQFYTYDNLHRLIDYQTGKMNDGNDAIEDYWRDRQQIWTFDAVGNQTAIRDFDQNDWYQGTFNKANEYKDEAGSRKIIGDKVKPYLLEDEFTNSDDANNYETPGSGDAFDIDATNSGSLTFITVSKDDIDGNETRAFVLIGETIGPAQLKTRVKLPDDPNSYAGIVFGYKDANDFWMLVLSRDLQKRCLYHVENGQKTLKASENRTVQGDTWYTLCNYPKRQSVVKPVYDFSNDGGYPSGKVGLVAGGFDEGFQFDYFYGLDDAVNADIFGRWLNNASTSGSDGIYGYDATDKLLVDEDWSGDWGSVGNPALLRNVRMNKFKVDFAMTRTHRYFPSACHFVFGARDPDHFNYLRIWHVDEPTPPAGLRYVDGGVPEVVSGQGNYNYVACGDERDTPVWVRVLCDDSNVFVYMSSSESGLDTREANGQAAYSSSNFEIDGGFMGFCTSVRGIYIDDLTVRSWTGSTWKTETVEKFKLNSARAEETPTHDAAGNLTYDGLHKYTYDAWNRLAAVERAWRDSDGNLQIGSVVASMEYDGLGRRTVKRVGDGDANTCEMGDWEATYHVYWDNWRMIETRNGQGSGQVLKQHVWGLTYVDELVQIAINQDPENADTGTYKENLCENFFYILQDAHYNVLGVVNPKGVLIERYEYTPYGQRTVFSHGWSPADFDDDGDVDSDDSQDLVEAIIGGSEPPESRYDLNGSGTVTSEDSSPFNSYKDTALAVAQDPLVTYPTLQSRQTRAGVTCVDLIGLCEIGHQGLSHDREFGLIYNRHRMLHPVLGRFLQRDPNEYDDGMSLYQYVGSNPHNRLDPEGLWILARAGASLGTGTAERPDRPSQYDTISSLAPKIGLDLGSWKRWITIPGGKLQTLEGIKTLFDLQGTTKMCPGAKVRFPNVVLAYWGGELGGFGKWWVRWGSDVSTLRARGFHVIEGKGWSSQHFEGYIRHAQADRILHGLFFWGHANPREVLLDSAHKDDDSYRSQYSEWHPHYRMGLGILFACDTASARADFSSKAKFWGKQGVLVPHGFHLFGTRVARLIPPGVQGTRQ